MPKKTKQNKTKQKENGVNKLDCRIGVFTFVIWEGTQERQ